MKENILCYNERSVKDSNVSNHPIREKLEHNQLCNQQRWQGKWQKRNVHFLEQIE